MRDRRTMMLNINEETLEAIVRSKVAFPPGSQFGRIYVDWELRSLRIEISNDGFPEVPEAAHAPNMMVTRNSVDMGQHAIWWLEAER